MIISELGDLFIGEVQCYLIVKIIPRYNDLDHLLGGH